jgi:hypothetical protein
MTAIRPLKRGKETGGHALGQAMLNVLAEMQESRLQRKTEGVSTPFGLAVQIIQKDYKNKDKEWKFRAIELFESDDKAATAFANLDAGAFRDEWLDRKML